MHQEGGIISQCHINKAKVFFFLMETMEKRTSEILKLEKKCARESQHIERFNL